MGGSIYEVIGGLGLQLRTDGIRQVTHCDGLP
jgi:hypothetical protein